MGACQSAAADGASLAPAPPSSLPAPAPAASSSPSPSPAPSLAPGSARRRGSASAALGIAGHVSSDAETDGDRTPVTLAGGQPRSSLRVAAPAPVPNLVLSSARAASPAAATARTSSLMRRPSAAVPASANPASLVELALAAAVAKVARLQSLDIFVLDNSVRETTVGQMRGHTLADKHAIMELVLGSGIMHQIVATFNPRRGVDDLFCLDLLKPQHRSRYDGQTKYVFSELFESVTAARRPLPDTPLGMTRAASYGIRNVIIELDMLRDDVEWEALGMDAYCDLLASRFEWIRRYCTGPVEPASEGAATSSGAAAVPAPPFPTRAGGVGAIPLSPTQAPRSIATGSLPSGRRSVGGGSSPSVSAAPPPHAIFVNIRDFCDAWEEAPERLTALITWLSRLQAPPPPVLVPNAAAPPSARVPLGHQRIAGIMIEDPGGGVFPFDMAVYVARTRAIMDASGWPHGHLLIHEHMGFGMAEAVVIECLAAGGTGIWAGICREGAAVGHANSLTTLANLHRLGNPHVAQRFNMPKLRQAAIAMTQLITGALPHPMTELYGARSLDIVFDGAMAGPGANPMLELMGVTPVPRISTMASEPMFAAKLTQVFGDPRSPSAATSPRHDLGGDGSVPGTVHTLDAGDGSADVIDGWPRSVVSKMKDLVFRDLNSGRKEEYDSAVGLYSLFERAGGKMTPRIQAALEADGALDVHPLLRELRIMCGERLAALSPSSSSRSPYPWIAPAADGDGAGVADGGDQPLPSPASMHDVTVTLGTGTSPSVTARSLGAAGAVAVGDAPLSPSSAAAGGLTYNEFYALFLARYLPCYECDVARAAFRIMDADGDGTISIPEIMLRAKWVLSQYPSQCVDVGSLMATLVDRYILPEASQAMVRAASMHQKRRRRHDMRALDMTLADATDDSEVVVSRRPSPAALAAAGRFGSFAWGGSAGGIAAGAARSAPAASSPASTSSATLRVPTRLSVARNADIGKLAEPLWTPPASMSRKRGFGGSTESGGRKSDAGIGDVDSGKAGGGASGRSPLSVAVVATALAPASAAERTAAADGVAASGGGDGAAASGGGDGAAVA